MTGNKIYWLLFFILLPQLVVSQITIEGQVSDDETNKPLAGANVLVEGTRDAATTNAEGYFKLVVPEEAEKVSVSFVGYHTKTVSVPDASDYLDIRLVPRAHDIQEVVIRGDIRQSVERIFHESRLPFTWLESEASASNSSVFSKLVEVPGVYIESQDVSGLSEKSVRIRGIKSYFSGMTVEGIPNYGIMPIGPRDYLYDMENIGSVSVYKGVIPSGVFSATGNKGGVIRLDFKRPEEEFGITARQSVGSDYYTRSFIRVDAGTLPAGTKVFGSYSYTKADKWKGTGNIGPRHNFTLGVTQDWGEHLSAELFFIHNRLKRHDFRELSYNQAENISENYQFHFLRELSDRAVDKAYYYDNNKGNFINSAIYGNLQFNVSDNLVFSLKPYFSAEDAGFWHKQITGPPQSPNYMLFNRLRNDKKAGLIAEGTGKLNDIRLSAGYWGELNDLSAKVHVYKLRTDAERLDQGINPETINTTPGTIHNPYLKVSGSPGNFDWHAGLKYFFYSEANTENYAIKGDERERLPTLDLKNTGYHAWLPTLGFGYSFNNRFQLSLAYGKNYMRPYMYGPMRSLYLRNKSAFLENDLTYRTILENWEMETSDQFSIKAGWKEEQFSLELSPFYTLHHNVLTPVLDPQVGIQYYQNVGEVKAHGLEIQGDIDAAKNFSLFFNASYTNMYYDQNLVTRSDGQQTAEIKGNQTPSVPLFSGIGGVRYAWRDLSLSGRLRHIGKRYGDATNQEELPAYNLINLKAGYNLKVSWTEKLELGLEVKNLLNTPYVGRIDVMDFQNQGNASYYAGMPRAFVLTVSSRF
ncbi:MAG: TonB-dependent receptor [Bacteroidales bacterium]